MKDPDALMAQMSWRGLLGVSLIGSRSRILSRIGVRLMAREVLHRANRLGIPGAEACDLLEGTLKARGAKMEAQDERPNKKG